MIDPYRQRPSSNAAASGTEPLLVKGIDESGSEALHSHASLIGRVSLPGPKNPAAAILQTASLSRLAVTDAMRQQLSQLCNEYFQADVPADTSAMLHSANLEVWCAPLEADTSWELLLVVTQNGDRAETLHLTVGLCGADLRATRAVVKEMAVIPEEYCLQSFMDEPPAEGQVVTATREFIPSQLTDILHAAANHPAIGPMCARLAFNLAWALALPTDPDGIPIRCFALFTVKAMTSSTFKNFHKGMIVLGYSLPGTGVLVDGILPGAFLTPNHNANDLALMLYRPTEQHALAAAAEIGVAPDQFFNGPVWFESCCLNLLVLSRASATIDAVLPDLSMHARLIVAKDLCSKLAMFHSLGYSHGDLKPNNLVAEIVKTDDAQTFPASTWIIDYGNAIDRGSWQDLVDRSAAFAKVLNGLAKHYSGNASKAEKRQLVQDLELLLGTDSTIREHNLDIMLTKFAQDLVIAIKQLVVTINQAAYTTFIFKDPGLQYLQTLASGIMGALNAAGGVHPCAGVDSCQYLASALAKLHLFCNDIDLRQADIWSLGVCLLDIAHGDLPTCAKIHQLIHKLRTSKTVQLHSGDLRITQQARQEIAGSLAKKITKGMDHPIFPKDTPEGRQFVLLLELARQCLQADPESRPSVEEVLDELNSA